MADGESSSNAADMRKRFDSKVQELLGKKCGNNNFTMTRERYQRMITAVKESRAKDKKEPADYRRVAKYEVVLSGGRERLIRARSTNNGKKKSQSNKNQSNKNVPIMYFLASDELFDVLHSTHVRMGHAGRNRLSKELKTRYCNITTEVIMIYLSLCHECMERKGFQMQEMPGGEVVVSKAPSRPRTKKRKKVQVAKTSSGQVDFVEMKSQPCAGFRFVMIYQDVPSKFVLLRALRNKTAKEVAEHLVDVFTLIGAPVILQMDGLDFCKEVIKEVGALWKDLKLVCGKRPSEDGGQRHKARRDVEALLVKWMADNVSSDWVKGLKMVQFMKNSVHSNGAKRSAYESMFGRKARVGLASFLEDLMTELITEEDIKKVISALDESSPHVSTDEAENVEEDEPQLGEGPSATNGDGYRDRSDSDVPCADAPNMEQQADYGSSVEGFDYSQTKRFRKASDQQEPNSAYVDPASWNHMYHPYRVPWM